MNNVKRAALVALFCGLGGIILHSQTDLRFGFQLSPTFGWMNTNENYINRSDGPNLGLKLAVLGERYFRENYAVTFGIGFAFNMGGTLLYEYPGKYWTRSDLGTGLDTLSGKPKLKYSVNYLEIPLGLKMRTREFGYFRFFGEPMVVLGFKNQSTGRIKSVTDAEDINIKKEVNGLNLSWGLGGGAE